MNDVLVSRWCPGTHRGSIRILALPKEVSADLCIIF